jgi:hypothetical protein
MAVRYFCDRCGAETREGELRVAELSIPPEPDISLELCEGCAQDARANIVGEREEANA